MVDSCFTQEQIAEYKEAFSMFDKNSDGVITVQEVGTVLRSLGADPTSQEIESLLNDMDLDRNGTIDFTEFLATMNSFYNSAKEISREEILDIFSIFDRDGDGYITGDEIMELTTILDENLTESEIKNMICEIDLDKDGRIDLEEFKKILLTKS